MEERRSKVAGILNGWPQCIWHQLVGFPSLAIASAQQRKQARGGGGSELIECNEIKNSTGKHSTSSICR